MTVNREVIIENQDQLTRGGRTTEVTVSTTRKALNTLLSEAVAERVSLQGRKALILTNIGSNVVRILDNSSAVTQPTTKGRELVADGEIKFDGATESFTANLFSDCGFYLATETGTSVVSVYEAK